MVSIMELMQQAWYMCWLALQRKTRGVRGRPGLQADLRRAILVFKNSAT
jgi:hypothetical protein